MNRARVVYFALLLIASTVHVFLIHRRVKKLGHPMTQDEAIIRTGIFLAIVTVLTTLEAAVR